MFVCLCLFVWFLTVVDLTDIVEESIFDEMLFCHYENKPIQIYWKFYHQKMKIFR